MAEAGSNAIAITESDFDEVVLQSDVPVLVDFWAEWCGPCKALAPKITELAGEYAGKAKIGKINIDENPNLASRWGVSAIPTLLIYKDGDVKERIVGLRAKKELADALDGVLAGG
jgi:thioredoxin 1